MTSVEDRLTALEKSLHRWRTLSVFLLLSLIAGLCVAAEGIDHFQSLSVDSLKAGSITADGIRINKRGLIVVDDKGKTVAALGNANGEGLLFVGGNSTDTFVSSKGIEIRDSEKTVLQLGLQKPEGGGGPSLRMSDTNGSEWVELGVVQDDVAGRGSMLRMGNNRDFIALMGGERINLITAASDQKIRVLLGVDLRRLRDCGFVNVSDEKGDTTWRSPVPKEFNLNLKP